MNIFLHGPSDDIRARYRTRAQASAHHGSQAWATSSHGARASHWVYPRSKARSVPRPEPTVRSIPESVTLGQSTPEAVEKHWLIDFYTEPAPTLSLSLLQVTSLMTQSHLIISPPFVPVLSAGSTRLPQAPSSLLALPSWFCCRLPGLRLHLSCPTVRPCLGPHSLWCHLVLPGHRLHLGPSSRWLHLEPPGQRCHPGPSSSCFFWGLHLVQLHLCRSASRLCPGGPSVLHLGSSIHRLHRDVPPLCKLLQFPVHHQCLVLF